MKFDEWFESEVFMNSFNLYDFTPPILWPVLWPISMSLFFLTLLAKAFSSKLFVPRYFRSR